MNLKNSIKFSLCFLASVTLHFLLIGKSFIQNPIIEQTKENTPVEFVGSPSSSAEQEVSTNQVVEQESTVQVPNTNKPTPILEKPVVVQSTKPTQKPQAFSKTPSKILEKTESSDISDAQQAEPEQAVIESLPEKILEKTTEKAPEKNIEKTSEKKEAEIQNKDEAKQQTNNANDLQAEEEQLTENQSPESDDSIAQEVQASSKNLTPPSDPSKIQDADNFKEAAGNPKPQYPIEDRKAQREGQVVFLAHINKAGRVDHIEFEKNANKSMDLAALEAFKNYRYQTNKETWIRKKFEFKLNGPSQELPSRLRRQAKNEKPGQ